MTQFIIAFGVLAFLLGTVMLFKPQGVFDFLGENADKPAIQILAIVLRLLLGFMLINQAAESKYPFVITMIGWIAIIAAVALTAIGREKFTRLILWASSRVKHLSWIAGFLACAFGLFLVYAFL